MTQPPEPPPSSGQGWGTGPGGGWNPQQGNQYGSPYGSSYGAPYGSPYGAPSTPRTNGKATASLVTGIAALVLSWCCGLGLAGIVAIVLGVKARNEIRASGGTQEGDGLALGGIITGVVAVVLGVLILVLIGLAVMAGSTFETTTTTYGAEL